MNNQQHGDYQVNTDNNGFSQKQCSWIAWG